jgi:hypothetical protein
MAQAGPLRVYILDMSMSEYCYNQAHKVVVCRRCHSCIVPGQSQLARHLRAEPHRLSGGVLQATAALLASYDLRSVAQLREHKPAWDERCVPIEHLVTYDGFRCLEANCGYTTRNRHKIQKHGAAVHQKRAIKHRTTQLWEPCRLQSYFRALNLIDYFVVTTIGAKAEA